MDVLHPLPAGLVALTGDEGSGKTRWLRRLCGDLVEALGLAPHRDKQLFMPSAGRT